MMISVPGISIHNTIKVRYPVRGFTILEILVVVAIISIIASTIVLNTNLNRPESVLKTHVVQLQKIMQLLRQEAILDDKNFAISLIPDSYLVLEYNGEEWIPNSDRIFKSMQKPMPYHDELLVDKQLITIEKTDEPKPHILILSSGEMSVFEWLIEDRKNQFKVRLSSTMLGDLTLEGPAESLI